MLNISRCSQGSSENSKNSRVRLSGHDSVHKQTKKIVLVMVDDDEDDCILVEAALEEARFNCIFRCIQDGCEMMDYLNRSGRYCNPEAAPIPDLILLDLNMPKMNGRDVLKSLKTSPDFRAIPVIILTTSTDVEDVKVCYDLGANSYITKHSSFDGLRSAIETIKEYWIDVATLPPKTEMHRFSEVQSKS